MAPRQQSVATGKPTEIRENGTVLSCSNLLFEPDRPSDVPVVASYCATFLKPEMLHIYRQITSLRRVRPVVIAQKRENEERFPFPGYSGRKKPALHFLRRIWFKQIADRPWQISAGEVH